jgi:hypothetical protein
MVKPIAAVAFIAVVLIIVVRLNVVMNRGAKIAMNRKTTPKRRKILFLSMNMRVFSLPILV